MIAFFTSAPPKQHIGLSFGEKRFPLGVGYLLTTLKLNGYNFRFYDRYLTEDRTFPEGNFEWIMIYSNTPCFEDTLRIINHYKGRSRIVVGGPHASIYPETLKDVDYIVQGEGEQAIIDIVKGKVDPGIVKYPRIQELDTLPRPDYNTFSKMPYTTTVKWDPVHPVFNYNSSRGCPFRCLFCDVKKIWGREYTYHSANRVVEDIEYLKLAYGIKGIYFREDNFTCNRQRLKQICEFMISDNLKIKWLCETRVNSVDEEIVELMARAGCIFWYVGFESGSQRMLDIYQKDTTVEQGIKAAELAHKYGIKFAGSFIEYHPEETPLDRQKTQEFINRTRPTTAWENRYRENFDSYVKEVMNAQKS